jgi:putative tributyrin esterase
MMNRPFFFLLLLGSMFARTHAQDAAVVVEDSLYSPSVARYMKFSAVLPPGYDASDERCTTVYLLHGFSGGYRDWVRNTGLVRYASQYRFLIITPDGQNGWWTNSKQVKNALYEDYVMKDLIPYVDAHYRTLATRHGRAIAGLSMGGYGAAKLALKYPGSFFYAASFSGAIDVPNSIETEIKAGKPMGESRRTKFTAFGETRTEEWTRNDVLAIVDSVDAKALPYLYLSVGHFDGIPTIIDATLALGVKLRMKHASFEMHETIGAHNWLFWDQEVRTLLEKLDRYDPLNVK